MAAYDNIIESWAIPFFEAFCMKLWVSWKIGGFSKSGFHNNSIWFVIIRGDNGSEIAKLDGSGEEVSIVIKPTLIANVVRLYSAGDRDPTCNST